MAELYDNEFRIALMKLNPALRVSALVNVLTAFGKCPAEASS